MPHLLVTDDMRDGYRDLVSMVLTGERAAPRGLETFELRGVTVEVTNPRLAVPSGTRPKLKNAIGCAETVHLLGGLSDAAQLLSIVSAWSNYIVDGQQPGAYGPRIANQLESIIKLLARDSDTRQAVALIWHQTELGQPSPDVPCTVNLQWFVRNGALEMQTTMRSQDIFLGVPYDYWMFTNLQAALAHCLGLELGSYRHVVGSLHAYARDLDALKNLGEPTECPPLFIAHGTDTRGGERDGEVAWNRWKGNVRALARGCVVDSTNKSFPASATWYRETLAPHRSGNLLCTCCHYVKPHEQFQPSRTFDWRSKCASCKAMEYRQKISEPNYHLKRKCAQWGLTTDQYFTLLADQDGKCAVCEREPDHGRWGPDFVFDHHHDSNRFRGLLCARCNAGLGFFQDQPKRLRAAARYLEEFNDER